LAVLSRFCRCILGLPIHTSQGGSQTIHPFMRTSLVADVGVGKAATS
jgi:hypothetical protein